MSVDKYFPDALHLMDGGMKGDSRLFILENDFHYVSSMGVIRVPKLFVTDGASIPRIFWNILQPFGIYFKAAIIHDYLYSNLNQDFTRLEADLIFKEAMFNLGLGFVKREAIFRAVRMFGWKSYKGYKE